MFGFWSVMRLFKSIVFRFSLIIYRIRQSQNANIWLGGDFKLGGIDWDTYSIKSKAQNTKQCKQLLDICQNNYLEQVV
jgi:hypothetical protein